MNMNKKNIIQIVVLCLAICAIIVIPIVLVVTLKKKPEDATTETPSSKKKLNEEGTKTAKKSNEEDDESVKMDTFWHSLYYDENFEFTEFELQVAMEDKFSKMKYYDDMLKIKIDSCSVKSYPHTLEINSGFELAGRKYTYDNKNQEKILDEKGNETSFLLCCEKYSEIKHAMKYFYKKVEEKNEWFRENRILCVVYRKEHDVYLVLEEKLEDVEEQYKNNDLSITLAFLKLLRGWEKGKYAYPWIQPYVLFLLKSNVDDDIRYRFNTSGQGNYYHAWKKYENKNMIYFKAEKRWQWLNTEQYDEKITSWQQYLNNVGRFLRWLVFYKRRFNNVYWKYKKDEETFLKDTNLQVVKVYTALMSYKYETFQEYIDYLNEPLTKESEADRKKWKNMRSVDPTDNTGS